MSRYNHHYLFYFVQVGPEKTRHDAFIIILRLAFQPLGLFSAHQCGSISLLVPEPAQNTAEPTTGKGRGKE